MLRERWFETYGQIYAPSRSTCGKAATRLSAEIALDLTDSTAWIFPSLMTIVCNPSSKVELAGSTTRALMKTTPFGADSSQGLIASFDNLDSDFVISGPKRTEDSRSERLTESLWSSPVLDMASFVAVRCRRRSCWTTWKHKVLRPYVLRPR